MMNSFMMDPFGPPPQQRGAGNNQRSNNNQISQRNNNNNSRRMMDPFDMMMASPFDRHNAMMARHHNPFSMVDQMMANMHGMMGNFNTIQADPSSQVYSSSSVITYSNSGDGKPRVYHESSETRQGPGGVKETKKMVRDSEKGVEKLAIGHHIGDRAHIIERQKYKDGKMEEVVNLENLDDGLC
jgi:myeloid leukemia factor 1